MFRTVRSLQSFLKFYSFIIKPINILFYVYIDVYIAIFTKLTVKRWPRFTPNQLQVVDLIWLGVKKRVQFATKWSWMNSKVSNPGDFRSQEVIFTR